jgi:hypothetical protein
MLVLNIHRLIALRGVKHPRAFLVNHGFTDSEARTLLDGGSTTVGHKMMMRLCDTFHCAPNDVYDWNGADDHHLARLKRAIPPDIKLLLDGKTPQEIEEILRRLSEG